MGIFYYPKITLHDYYAFKRLLVDKLPESHEAWAYLQSKKISLDTHAGDKVWKVSVHPDEFTRYCDLTDLTRSLKNLDIFASEKAHGKHY